MEKTIWQEISVVVYCKPTWQNLRACQTITNNTCPDVYAELLLVSRLEYTIRIVLYTLVVSVEIFNAVATKTCLVSKEY
jgi:hypothetical protein